MTFMQAWGLLRDLLKSSGVTDEGKPVRTTSSVDGDELVIGRIEGEVLLSFDTSNELGQPWGVAALTYYEGNREEPPSQEAGPWTSYPTAQEACRAAVLLLVTLRMDAWLAGMAEEGAER